MKRVNTDEQCVTENGVIFRPIITLANKEGGRCQVSIDGDCYVVRLKREDGKYELTPFIFKEVLEELKGLPVPSLMKYLLYSTEFIKKEGKYGDYFEHYKHSLLRVWITNGKVQVGKKDTETNKTIHIAEVESFSEFFGLLRILLK